VTEGRVAQQLTIAEYYRIPAVRHRIREYCGGSDRDDLTCVFLSGLTPGAHSSWNHSPQHPVQDLDRLLAAGADISRSAWDSRDLLVHLDIDYQHIDRPAEAFEHPADAFVKLEPTRCAVQQLLQEFDLPLLAIMTGRGYHFTGRVPLANPLLARLSELAPLPAWLATCPARRPPWTTVTVTPMLARAYTAVGMLVEYLAQLAVRRAASRSRIPVVGRECASLDFTYAGDPIDIRQLRVAFSAYQTHHFRPDTAGTLATLPALVAVPVASRPLLDILQEGREPAAAAILAGETSAVIPVVPEGTARLLEAYQSSSLARFHRDFYGTRPDPPSQWPVTYDRLDLASLIPCVGASLASPNDLLLKPEHVQHVARYLSSQGWHPRHIAGLVHSRYARDFGWGDRWMKMDAQTRAEFDVRVFAGMIATGLDEAIDFNCRSAQEKGLCPGRACTHDLRLDRDRLLARAHA
jgi:hypothetical protein